MNSGMRDKTFTNTEPSIVEKVNLKEVDRIAGELREAVARRFEGVPVSVDNKLTGCSYYIIVSQELYDQIEQNTKEDKERGMI